MTIALLAAGCADDSTTGSTTVTGPTTVSNPPGSLPDTELRISVWPSGTDGPVRQWNVTCPDGGNLPNRAGACRRLAGTARTVFSALPLNVSCTEIYGGPQVASVSGRFRGRAVAARFSRRNGCEIERWDRVRYLFPVST